MAEDQNQEAEAQTEEGGEGGSSKLPLILMLAGVLVLGAGIGAGVFLLLMGGDEAPAADGEKPAAEAAAAPAAPAEAAAPAPELDADGNPIPQKPAIFFYEVPEILVNLSSRGSATRYLKLKINLEVGSEADLESLGYVIPRVVDDFQLYLRQLRVEDLSGSAGIYRLKEDLLMRANQSAQPLKIKNVLFKEILVQ